ncbi:unnamed protein product [Litomosoides sigmodontis]|uniref:Uncharacterized protein n=1 Tax=Litomosoides sigmodontis TaxID=42156 RepID=A0A3P6TR58_LITSI|nr:unnamed protein product [Litomosoides sigmodontis]
MVAASTVVSAKGRLPSCKLTPKLLCCTERHVGDRFSLIANKCPHKMQNYGEIITTIIGSYRNIESKFYNQQSTSISATIPITLPMAVSQNVRRQSFKTLILLVQQNLSITKLFELPKGCYVISGMSRRQAPIYRTYSNYTYVNQQHPMTSASDCNLSSRCSTENSRPVYSAYLSQKLFDPLFLLTCRQQHVPTNSHTFCTYKKHREHIAVEAPIQAIRRNAYDLKHSRTCCTALNDNTGIGIVAFLLRWYHRNWKFLIGWWG